MVEKKDYTWEELVAMKSGTILHDEFDEGIRFIVMRGPDSLCAYVGVTIDHPLAEHSYEDLPVIAHGGLTFASKGRDAWPEGWFWYGWDYSHCDDYAFYYDQPPLASSFLRDGRKWLVKDVLEDSWETIYGIKKLLKLAEDIQEKGGE